MKSLDKLLSTNSSEIGFFTQKSKSIEKLNIFGVTYLDSNENKFDCDAYIVSQKNKKSPKSMGKYIESSDTNKSIENFDFIILENTKDTDRKSVV